MHSSIEASRSLRSVSAASSSLVAIFLPSLGGGGAERAMLVFAAELAKRGYNVDIVVGKSGGVLTKLIPEGVRIVELHAGRTATSLMKLARYLRSNRPDALYSTIAHANIIAAAAAKIARTGCRVIVRESNVPVTEPKYSVAKWMTYKLVPTVYQWTQGVIAVSEGVGAELRKLLPNFSDRIAVIPTPVVSLEMLSAGTDALEHPWFLPGSPPVVLAAARLQPHKGFDTLITAFSQVRKNVRCRLMILGEGPDHERLEDLAAESGFGEDIMLAGFKPNPFPFMRQAAVFVLASRYEGLPNVLIQAMAFGTPVVSTDCPSGPAEILDSGRFGELVSVGDAEAMADAITRALGVTRRMDAATSVAERFGAELATSRYLQLAGLPARAEMSAQTAVAV